MWKQSNIVDIHADDYGLTIQNSTDILNLIKQNKINSISVLPNFKCFEECMLMLNKLISSGRDDIAVSVHLNLMEGCACRKHEDVTALTDAEGRFSVTWGKLLIASMNPFTFQKIKAQIKSEFISQIDTVKHQMGEDYKVRIDSHQHTHVIPIVREALIEILGEKRYPVEFVRIPKEPLKPFIKHTELWKTYSLVNIVKHVILNRLSASFEKKITRLHQEIKYGLLWGVIMSGWMDHKRVGSLYQDMFTYAKKKEQTMEILFHPGTVEKEELTKEYTKEGFVDFHLSKGRKEDWESIHRLSL